MKHGLVLGVVLGLAVWLSLACQAGGAGSAPPGAPGPNAAAPSNAAPPAPGAGATSSAAPAPAAAPPAPEPLTYGFTALVANHWPIFVAEARGYFVEQGIDLDASVLGSAAASVQALTANSVDLVNANPDPLVRAVVGGADLVILAGTQNPPIYSLYSQKDVTSIAALRGKTIIVGGPKDVTVYLLDRMLTPHGLQRGDYDLVFAGGTPDRLRALQSGAVQAAMLTQPFEFAAKRDGYPMLVDSPDYVPSLPFTATAVARGWLANDRNRERAVRYLAAAYRGARDVCDPAQKDAMIRVLAEKTQLSDEDAAQTYVLLVEQRGTMKCDLRLTPDELQKVIDYIVEMGDLPPPGPDPRRIVDAGALDQAIARVPR